ncbi:MAG: hypothetical protein RLZZ123_2189 [Pseudomonadota bacterium]
MNRSELVHRLSTHAAYDLVVVGGGATGLGVGLDAALRGFSVLVLDAHDFGGGTSSRSTKLLHGGVRYLAQGHWPLVRDALRERQNVLHNAPHLSHPLPFVLPAYQWGQLLFWGLGLKLYEFLAGQAGLGATQWLSPQETLQALPGLQAKGLRGGILYWDAQFDDARLALALARSIEQAGGLPLNHAEVCDISGGHGQSFVLTVQDRQEGVKAQVQARAVVNATGVWVDEFRQKMHTDRSALRPERMVTPSQGVHMVVDRKFMPADHAMLVPHTQDGRVLFIVPWMGSVLLGTTDTPRADLPREPQPFDHEIEFILSEASKYLSQPVRREDIQSIWVGLRPLVAPQQGGTPTRQLSREHLIVTDHSGLISVTGGKWTTYRAMAESVLHACFDAGVLPSRPGGQTVNHALSGANGGADPASPIHQAPGPHLYGQCWVEVQRCPGHDQVIGMGLTQAMVRYAARCEYACTVEDVLARRWRALFLNAREAMAMAPTVARILSEETETDPQLEGFMQLASAYMLKAP